VELKQRAQAEKEHRKKQMPVAEHAQDAIESEEEVFAVLCVWTQLLCLGLMWWVGLK
jgi:UDP-N-acetylmuramyl pentapeptide phosphotransferase/UDP-N-acetylglucosamine-1-phosphate transferase